eukprot:TRINITY_DN7454_c0_g1_i1.p1 TRINITY_DN7454_c0_g1~~TRINITY_DN7454_c0_g1_i1.p1  ORF type:complete len:133 (-),score=53.64 TRINITY_DN7454_c0_g1_i1:101-499(-)
MNVTPAKKTGHTNPFVSDEKNNFFNPQPDIEEKTALWAHLSSPKKLQAAPAKLSARSFMRERSDADVLSAHQEAAIQKKVDSEEKRGDSTLEQEAKAHVLTQPNPTPARPIGPSVPSVSDENADGDMVISMN